MHSPCLTLVSAGMFVALIGLAAQAPAKDIADALQPFVENHTIAGAVTLVADRDKILSLETAGYADLAAKKPMRPDSLFWIASMTKPVTATAVLMLRDEGKLSVDDPVAKYLPELANLKTAGGKPAKLTLRHLLTHTSGMGEATPQESRAARTLADLISRYAERPLQFEPGTKWQYCQSGINSLGRIVEVVSGQSFPEFLQRRLFDPLAMKDTTFYPTREQMARLAKSYQAADGKLAETTIFILDGHDPAARDRYPAANGGLFSTARDYGRFCRMLLNQGTLGGRRYLKPESVKLMSTIQTGDLKTGFTEGNGWGLGCCVVRKPQGATAVLSPGTFGHGGAYGTQAWIDPARQAIYVLMVQRSNFPNADASDVRRAFQEAAAATVTGKP
ncbi:MAG: serine hydrolase domain-containing protein [Thermoguttaceae bacterium]|jgi:CubicO group peptidase (beta-lactamase class C family)